MYIYIYVRKKYRKVCKALEYTDQSIILIYAVTGCD